MPWRIFMGRIGSASTFTSEWLWVSMNPGQTTWPAQSIVSGALSPLATAATRPSLMPTSALARGRPDPSMTVPPLRTRSRSISLEHVFGDVAVRLRAPVPVELPVRADLRDEVEVEVGHDQLVLVAAADREDLPVGVAEVRRPVELAEVPGLLAADAVVGADEVAVGDGHGRLLDLPEVVAVAGRRRAGHEDDLRAVQAEHAPAFGEVPV